LELTDREQQILDLIQKEGAVTPTHVASKFGISQAGASQALQRMSRKGLLARKAAGKRVYYQQIKEDATYLYSAYNALSQVWAYLMALGLSDEKMARARRARDTLEGLLAEKAK
jgi:Mn-dependent DtxR family transcriptional regulator